MQWEKEGYKSEQEWRESELGGAKITILILVIFMPLSIALLCVIALAFIA